MTSTSESNRLIGYTAGVFDCFHIGHVNLLRAAREHCDHLVVGVTTDELAAERKGSRPVVPLLERMEIVQSVRYVDHVLPQFSMDKVVAWETVKFDLLFVGANLQGTDEWNGIEQVVSGFGSRVTYLPYTHTRSDLIGRLDNGRGL